MVIPTFIQQALQNEPITVYGDGTQRRSFTWVRDAINALIALTEHSDAVGDVFNIGHHKDISIYELAKMVKEITKSESDIIFVPYNEAYEEGFEDMKHRVPSISKIKRLIGYKPTLDLPEILERIINWYRSK